MTCRLQPGAVEANHQSLTRDFGACISIPLLYGHDFLERYPQLLDDFWKFDNDIFPLLMIGIPPWAPFKVMKEGRNSCTVTFAQRNSCALSTDRQV